LERKDLAFIKDKDTLDLIQHIFENGQGNVQELESAPVAALPILAEDCAGVYGTNLYWRKNGKVYVFATSSVITIT